MQDRSIWDLFHAIWTQYANIQHLLMHPISETVHIKRNILSQKFKNLWLGEYNDRQ